MSISALARPEIVAMKPYSSARSEAAANGILLNANESPWPLIDDPLAREEEVGPLNRYPEPQHAKLVGLLAALYGLPSDHVLVTRGSDEGIDLLVRVFCRAGRDSILDTPPSFGMYRIAAQTQGAGIISVPRDEETLALDCDAILKAVSNNTPPRLIFLTSPANPTGDLVEPAFLDALLRATENRSMVVVDEAYSEFTPAESFRSRVKEHSHLVVLRTLSKAYGAAGLRCGATLAQPQVIELLKRVIPPYPLATPVLSLALRLFDTDIRARQGSMLEKIRANKLQLLQWLEKQPFVERLWPGEANFVLIRISNPAALIRHCANAGIVIRGFSGVPMVDSCVRITVGSREEINRLAEVVESFDPGAGASAHA
jgi:histidinol-phosphate aminotransferase